MSAAAEDDARLGRDSGCPLLLASRKSLFRKVPPNSPEDQEAVLAALESLVATTGTETKTGRSHVRNQPPRYERQIFAIRPAEAPKAAQTKAAKKRSSSSSSEDKRSLGASDPHQSSALSFLCCRACLLALALRLSSVVSKMLVYVPSPFLS